MATFSRILLSGTPANGKCIVVDQTAPGGTVIHTAVDGDTAYDEVYLMAANTHTAAVGLTVEWGGTANPGDHACDQYSLPPLSAPILVIPGISINGGLEIRAYATSANKINIFGHVNRIQ